MPRFTARDGQSLNYFDIGKGPVCVLVHGFGMQAAMWLPLVLPLSRQYRFILPDLRGYGGSATSVFSHDSIFDHFADDLHDLVDALSIDSFCLAGFSMGGTTSMQYQRVYGSERLNAYLQIDQSHVITNKDDWAWGLYGSNQAAVFSEFRPLLDEMEMHQYKNRWSELPRPLKEHLLHAKASFVADTLAHPKAKQGVFALHKLGLSKYMVPPKSWPAFIQCLKAYMVQENDYRDVFNNYSKPLWVFAGTKSELYPVEGQRHLVDSVSDGTLVEFESCGHCLPYERPLKFVQSLKAFLDSASVSAFEHSMVSS